MTRQDIQQIDTLLTKRLKEQRVEIVKEVVERINEAEMNIITLVDKHKIDKKDVEGLEKRVEKLEQHVY